MQLNGIGRLTGEVLTAQLSGPQQQGTMMNHAEVVVTAAVLFCVFAVVFVLLQRRSRKLRVSTLRDSDERHRIDSALHEQRVTLTQNEALMEEIRERRKVETKLRHLAFHDSLTGLPNRESLLDLLTVALRKVHSRDHDVAVLLHLDLDSFKLVNDTTGRRSGDMLLCEAGRRLARCVRTGDVVTRIGGDKFAVVLSGLQDVQQAYRMANRILGVLEDPVTLPGIFFPVTASIGLCHLTQEYTAPEQVLRDADVATRRAKKDGGARAILYTPEMKEDALAAVQAKVQLKAGIEREEFVLFYQPLVDMRDRSFLGMEALIRWNHPSRGLLAPGAFIQLAEETKLIVPMGQWVLHQACKDLKILQDKSPRRKLLMSLNVSSHQLDVPSFLSELKQVLTSTEVNPSSIQLEITESIFIKDATRIGELFNQIRLMGVQIAFDDFGTGYSSLSYLERYPIDTLKLDQSFVQNMRNGSVNAEIVKFVMQMSQAVGMKVSAEGVETPEQAATLVQHGCVWAQGYLYSKPVPIAKFMEMLAADQSRLAEFVTSAPVLLFPEAETRVSQSAAARVS